MTTFSLTKHARTRANQRGITLELIEALLVFADMEVPAEGGCTCLRCSREALAAAELRAVIGSIAERLQGLAAIVADDTGEIVTVFHDHGRADGRRYRRAH
jgi:hypothetical protein